jgi:K+ transport systems, NAD-binding component
MGKNERSFVVLGAGRFGQSVAKTLYSLGNEVLLIDRNEDVIQAMSKYCTHAIIGDCRDENVLNSIGVRNFDVAIVAVAEDFEASVLVSVMLKEMGVPYVIAKVQNDIHGRVLEKVGVDSIVFPERDSAIRLARNLTLNNFMDYMELSPDYSIAEIKCLDSWVGKSLDELNIRSKYGINVMAIKNEDHINVSPNAQDKLSAGDVLIVIASEEDLNRIR